MTLLPTVLLIEDDPDVLESITLTLKDHATIIALSEPTGSMQIIDRVPHIDIALIDKGAGFEGGSFGHRGGLSFAGYIRENSNCACRDHDRRR